MLSLLPSHSFLKFRVNNAVRSECRLNTFSSSGLGSSLFLLYLSQDIIFKRELYHECTSKDYFKMQNHKRRHSRLFLFPGFPQSSMLS